MDYRIIADFLAQIQCKSCFYMYATGFFAQSGCGESLWSNRCSKYQTCRMLKSFKGKSHSFSFLLGFIEFCRSKNKEGFEEVCSQASSFTFPRDHLTGPFPWTSFPILPVIQTSAGLTLLALRRLSLLHGLGKPRILLEAGPCA